MKQEKAHLFDKPKNVKRLLHTLYAICAVLFVVDFVFHRHSIHPWESFWGFYAIYGFIGCVVLVLVAAQMRKIVMRDEQYYEPLDKVEGHEQEQNPDVDD